MRNEILEVIRPLKDEDLYSWTIRMVRLYKVNRNTAITPCVIETLFGYYDEHTIPAPIWQNGIDFFSNHCDMTPDSLFSKPEEMLKRMSVLPFYSYFDPLVTLTSYKSYYDFFKSEFFSTENSQVKEMYIAFCPKCLEE